MSTATSALVSALKLNYCPRRPQSLCAWVMNRRECGPDLRWSVPCGVNKIRWLHQQVSGLDIERSHQSLGKSLTHSQAESCTELGNTKSNRRGERIFEAREDENL